MASEKVVIKSRLTGLEQTVTPQERKTIDPYNTRFTTVREVATPPEAKTPAKKESEK